MDLFTVLNKTIASEESIICHDWHRLDNGFNFHSSVCNGFHDVLLLLGLAKVKP